MSDKNKNKVTNLLGLVFYGLSVYSFFLDKEIKYIVGLLVIGSVLFLFKNSSLVDLLKGVLNKNKNIKSTTVDGEREYPDERG
jgi:hypothetical protein